MTQWGYASMFEAREFRRNGGQMTACVPPPKKAVLSWLTAAPNVEGGRREWGFFLSL